MSDNQHISEQKAEQKEKIRSRYRNSKP